MPPKKGKEKPAIPAKAGGADLKAGANNLAVKPKRKPKPPACFTPEDLMRFKAIFKAFDEEKLEKLPLNVIPQLLRKLGFNPKPAEINELYARFLADEFVDTVEYHELLKMIEAKMIMGDDVENEVMKAMAALGHDDEANTKMCPLELLKEELQSWGNPLLEIEFAAFKKVAVKEKCYIKKSTGLFAYEKFVDVLNAKDTRFLKEEINYFKLDQKTLAAIAQKKVDDEKAEQAKKDAERVIREEARRQKMIRDGLLPPD